MTQERLPIEDVDWRYRVATTLAKDFRSPTGVVHKKGTPVSLTTFIKHGKQELRIGDPSATALFLSQSHKAYTRALEAHPFLSTVSTAQVSDPSGAVYDYLELAIASVVFAYTAIEAFVNEAIPDDFLYEASTENGLVVAHSKDWVERHLSLDEKLATVLPNAMSRPSPKGRSIWEKYVALRRLRDRIIHMKSRDRAHSKAGNLYPDSIWNRLLDPKQLNYPLVAKNIMLHFYSKANTHWLKYCPF